MDTRKMKYVFANYYIGKLGYTGCRMDFADFGTVSGQKKTGTKMTTVQIQIWRTHTLYVILKTTQMGIF
jgi:hypothetical protein